MDNINPKHYQGKVECIDAIETATEGLEGIEAVCTANVIKYLWRWKKKNGAEDLLKAEWYLKRLIELVYQGNQKEEYRPIVTIIKHKNGIPTVIEIGEQRYQLQHPDQYKRG